MTKCNLTQRNLVWRAKEKARPNLGEKSIAKKRRFVKLSNKLNKIDRCLGRKPMSATLSINKKGVIKQRK